MSDFQEGILDCNGVSIRYVESGAGETVVIFSASDEAWSDEVAVGLAVRYRDMVLDVPASGVGKLQDFAVHVSQALARLGVKSFSVIGISQSAAFALAQAVHTPAQVRRLVLLSPPLAAVQHPELGAKLREVKAPTLVLVGTRDRSGSREAGRLCRESISTCHLLLVYEAGHAIAVDRREACLSPIGEFLEQGEGFIVSHDSQLIRP
jgi:pimeloyl-ACP methyl ester carboxylesterase